MLEFLYLSTVSVYLVLQHVEPYQLDALQCEILQLHMCRVDTAATYSSIQNELIDDKLGLKPLITKDARGADQPEREH